MTVSAQQHKSDICAVIQKATCTQDLTAILNNIDFGDLQSLLHHYVMNQASPESVTKLHRRSMPLTRYIATDCLQHTLQFLDIPEMCLLSVTNQLFRDLLKKEKDRIMNHQLLGHQAFFEFIYSEQNSRDLVTIKFALQKEYDLHDLNRYSFDEMGQRGILEGEDMSLWQICHHFGWRKQMFAVFEDDEGDPFIDCGERPWRTPYERVQYFQTFDSFNWKMSDVAGVGESIWWRYDSSAPQLRPIVEVKCPDKAWWNGFISRNIKGNRYEHLLRVHPAFKNNKKSDKNSEHLIGYVFHHEYKSEVWKTPMTELGEKNNLKGMDMIIWKLCKHFGFEMSLYLIDGDNHFVCRLPIEHILDASGIAGILMHDLSEVKDWHPHEWDVILGHKIVRYSAGNDREEGSRASAQNYDSYDEYVAMEIRCKPLNAI